MGSEMCIRDRPIGEQTQGIEEEVEFSKTHSSTIDWVDVGLNVSATGSFSLFQLARDKAKELPVMPLPDGYCVVNQDVRAGYKLGANATGQIKLLKIGAGLDKTGSIEFDSFYQSAESVPTHKVIWSMFQSPVRPWSLPDVEKQLARVTQSGAVNGYRCFTIKTTSSPVSYTHLTLPTIYSV